MLAAGWLVVWLARADPASRAAALVRSFSGRSAPESDIGGPFSLIDSNGRPVTDQSFRGRWMLVYFGYAYCPDICPTMLQTISMALDQLGSQAAQIAPLFITVDPDRDTPTAIGQYVALFDPRLIGLTGTPAQVAGAESAYRVSSRRVTLKGNGAYMMDHSSYAYLMNPDGRLMALFQADATAPDMAETIRTSILGAR